MRPSTSSFKEDMGHPPKMSKFEKSFECQPIPKREATKMRPKFWKTSKNLHLH